MDQRNSKSLLTVILSVIITALVVGGGMYWWQLSLVPQLTTESKKTTTEEIPAESTTIESTATSNRVVKYNCEQSGGTFSNDACSCPTEQGEKLTYDSNTGYCMSAFGSPGGEQGETTKKLQELEMLKNQ